MMTRVWGGRGDGADSLPGPGNHREGHGDEPDKAGYPVTMWNRTPEKREPLVARAAAGI